MFDWSNGHLVVTTIGSAELLRVGPLVIRYYALAYVLGLLGCWWTVKRMVRLRSYAPFTPLQFDDYMFYAVLGVILGGRVGYAIFYKSSAFIANPLMLLKVWEGGMSYHGGMLGVTLSVLYFCRTYKIDWVRFHDYIVCGAPIGLFLGRLANFLNGELWGAPTTQPWGVIFLSDPLGLPRHPSQLYEAAFEGLVLFLFLGALFWKTDARLWRGRLSGWFLLGYGSFRFALEYIREADSYLQGKTGLFHMGQWLSLPMMIVGLILIIRAKPITT